jgi:regulatory protein
MARRPTQPRRPPPPIGAEKLAELALAYVARFATTRARLARYLSRKVKERGWEGTAAPADVIAALVEKHADQGFVDDRRFAEARADSLSRRGFGLRRVRQTLWSDGITADDAEPVIEARADSAWDTAIAFARRRRVGPFATAPITDPKLRERQIAAFLRAGHGMALARRILALPPGASLLDADDLDGL